jgi:hypothetical protein
MVFENHKHKARFSETTEHPLESFCQPYNFYMVWENHANVCRNHYNLCVWYVITIHCKVQPAVLTFDINVVPIFGSTSVPTLNRRSHDTCPQTLTQVIIIYWLHNKFTMDLNHLCTKSIHLNTEVIYLKYSTYCIYQCIHQYIVIQLEQM